MQILDLFSGIGGFSLGLERAGMTTAAFCEIDPFCRQILRKHWPDTPIFTDVRTIRNEFTGTIELICGGYPCQPFSVAGKRKGQADDRHLWPEMFACIKHYQPTWVIGENVAGHISMGLDDVLFDLESEGYAVRVFVLPACAIGAPHRRDRVWTIAHTHSERSNRRRKIINRQNRKRPSHSDEQNHRNKIQRKTPASPECHHQYATDTVCDGIQRRFEEKIQRLTGFSWCKDIRKVEEYFGSPSIPQPLICRDDYGFSKRVDRLRSLGNAVVPQITEIIGRAIMAIEHSLHTNKEN